MPIAATEHPPVTSDRTALPAGPVRNLWEKLEKAGNWLDHRPVLLATVLTLAYLIFLIPYAAWRPMWHDELFTYNLALLPTISQMFHDIRLIDLNPPLLYLLDYLTLRLPGVHGNDHVANLAARLPLLLAGLAGSLGFFAWLRPRLGPLWSLLGVSLLWDTMYYVYAAEDRPYELMVAFAILLLLVRDRAIQSQRRPVWVGVTILLGAAMVGSHFMGCFVLLAFLAAEAVRAWKLRRLDLSLTVAYLLPFAIVAVYHGKVAGYETILFPDAFLPHLATPLDTYLSVAWHVAPALLVSVVLLLIPGKSPSDHPMQRVRSLAGQVSLEYALLVGLLIEPLLAIAMMVRDHGAFFPRYGLPACIPIAVLVAFLLCALFNRSRAVAVLATLALWWFPFRICVIVLGIPHTVHAASADNAPHSADFHTIDPNLPFVDASALTYVEMNHRESPAFLRRTWYLTDHDGAVRYGHATLFESEAEVARIFHFQSHVDTLPVFEAAHPKFLVLGTWDYPEQWLLRKLHADGDLVRYLGDYNSGYVDQQLYEVTVVRKAQ